MDLVLWQWVIVFGVATAVVVRAGIAVASAADEIATLTGAGRLLIGSVLLAAGTSLPELASVVTAGLEDAPDLAVGTVLGSSMANMALLAVVDLVGRQRVLARVGLGHARVAGVAIALTALAVLGVITPDPLTLGGIGIESVAIAVAYFAAVAWMRRSPAPRGESLEGLVEPTGAGARAHPGEPLSAAARRFALGALAIFIAAPVMTTAAGGIAETGGLGETFVGAALLATVSSAPELSASLAAVRIGADDLAVGNLFGSNAFNVALLLFADLAYAGGPVLGGADPSQAVAGVAAIGLMAIALVIVVQGEETRILRAEPDAVFLLLAYLGALAAVWAVS